ncbi:MAG TPA: DUF3667 domain-containing protein [Bacteroidia bacterium]|nr:DUF3667 domain-containing protein [Bacteroidia bacterium]
MNNPSASQEVCKNCGETLAVGYSFCPHCGQTTHSIKQPLAHFISEALETIFHFDTKLFRTVRDLFVRPGQLTINYNQDKRARYVPPVRFYIFVSFIFFLVLNYSGNDIATLPQPTINIDTTGTKTANIFINDSKNKANGAVFAKERIDSLLNDPARPKSFLQNVMYRVIRNSMEAKSDDEGVRHKWLKYISVSLFFLMPLFALMLQLFYYSKRIYYTEHLVYSLHIHTLLFIMLLFGILVRLITAFDLTPYVFAGMFLYLVLSLKNVYENKFPMTLLKSVLVTFVYLIFVMVSILIATVGSLA